ncbi:AbfB domain-containing protein [Actinoplanes sp. NPDC023801]|uniref:AbfB domain-containing protein n=1 Tax=Actinoplanes sp. NPDC023801 TaxID=3154595 RepID=UPI003407D1E0
MTEADNSETQRVGVWIPPYAHGATEHTHSSTPGRPRRLPGAPPVAPAPGGSGAGVPRSPLLALVAATAFAVLCYGIVAVTMLDPGSPLPAPQFRPVPPGQALGPASPPVSVLPESPSGPAVATSGVRKVRGDRVGQAGTAAAAPSRAASSSPPFDPAFTPGRTVGIGPVDRPGQRIRNRDFVARVEDVSAAGGTDARFTVRRGLAVASCVSFESVSHPGFYLRHRNFVLLLERAETGALYLHDATFCPVPVGGAGFALRSVNYPDHHLARSGDAVRLLQATPAQATAFRAVAPN